MSPHRQVGETGGVDVPRGTLKLGEPPPSGGGEEDLPHLTVGAHPSDGGGPLGSPTWRWGLTIPTSRGPTPPPHGGGSPPPPPDAGHSPAAPAPAFAPALFGRLAVAAVQLQLAPFAKHGQGCRSPIAGRRPRRHARPACRRRRAAPCGPGRPAPPATDPFAGRLPPAARALGRLPGGHFQRRGFDQLDQALDGRALLVRLVLQSSERRSDLHREIGLVAGNQLGQALRTSACNSGLPAVECRANHHAGQRDLRQLRGCSTSTRSRTSPALPSVRGVSRVWTASGSVSGLIRVRARFS